MSRWHKVYIVKGGSDYRKLYELHGFQVVRCIDDADIVQFTGGEDVTPAMYKHGKHPKTMNNPIRDYKEALIFNQCIKENKIMAGICRGGQFLNVMCGGNLWQHVNNHAIKATHRIYDHTTGNVFRATSTHHQMMDPGPRGAVLAVAAEATELEKTYSSGKILSIVREDPESNWQDTEVVLYQEQRVLCFQPHPEYDTQRNGALGQLFFTYLARLL